MIVIIIIIIIIIVRHECDAGEKLTEDELADHLTTLLGDTIEEMSLEAVGPLDDGADVNLLERHLPETIGADVFIRNIIGFTTGDNSAAENPRPSMPQFQRDGSSTGLM